jgi:hypothetical protein
MSDYNLQIAWSGKDALADSDPDKVVSGGDFNTEFLAVKTAVNSKADLANTSQVVTAATAAAGTNTNQVATTAFVDTSFAKKASPALTGTPTAPTASVNTNTTQIATTAFVEAAKPAGATASTLGLVKVSLSGTTLTISTS